MQNKILRGRIALENGIEAAFFLKSSEVELLEREAEEMREFYQDLETRTGIIFPGYSIMDELVCAAIEPYLKELKKKPQRILGR